MIRFNFKRLILAIFVTFIFTNPSYSAETNELIKVNWSFKKLTGKYSAFTIAGAAVGVTHNKFKK